MGQIARVLVPMTPVEVTQSFRAATGKRKGGAVLDDGLWTVVDAQGHTWCLVPEDGWVRFSDDDDDYVTHLRRSARRQRSTS